MAVKSLFAAEQTPSTAPVAVAVTSFNSATNIITSSASAAPAVGTAVAFTNAGGALPSGLSTGKIYYVITSVGATFSVSTTVGGAVVALVSAGTGVSSYWAYSEMASDVFWVNHQTLKIDEGITLEDRDDEVDGTNDSRSSIPIQYDPAWEMKLRAYPNLFGLPLLAFFGSVTTTAGDGIITDPDGNTIPVGAYKHVFSYKTGIDARTLAYQGADQHGNFWHATGMGIKEIKLAGNKGALDADVKGSALFVESFGDPGAAAFPADTLAPWSFGELALTWLGSSEIVEQFDLTFAQDAKTIHAPTQATKFPTYYELDKSVGRKLTGNCNKRDFSLTDWNALTAGTYFQATAKYKTAQVIGATTYPYSMWVDMPSCQYQKGTADDIQKSPRRAYKLTWKAAYNVSSGYAYKVTLVNGASGYMTGIT